MVRRNFGPSFDHVVVKTVVKYPVTLSVSSGLSSLPLLPGFRDNYTEETSKQRRGFDGVQDVYGVPNDNVERYIEVPYL